MAVTSATPKEADPEPVPSMPDSRKPPANAAMSVTDTFAVLHGGLPRAARHLLMVATLVVIIAGMRAASSVLALFMLAAFFAAICTVPLTWLRRRAVPSKLAVGVTAGGIFVLGSLLVVLVAVSVNSFLADLPQNQQRLNALSASAIAWLNAHGAHVSGEALSQRLDLGIVMGFAGAMLAGLSGVIASGFLVLVTIVFMLLEAAGFPKKLRMALNNPERSLAGLREFSETARRYLLIKTLVGVAVGAVIGLWLWILGLNYAFLWGFLAFLLNFVPYIGCYIAAVPALLLALVELGPGSAGLALLGYLAANLVTGYLVEPRLMGAQLGLSPLVVFASLLIWGWVLGPVGTILSVPLTVLLRIALEAKPDTRWIAILLGPEPPETNRKPAAPAAPKSA
jgi:AI-2 transport protein TqsA